MNDPVHATPSPVYLGERVRTLRTAVRVSQVELARRARLSQPRISQIEAGRVAGPLPLRTLCDLADGLGVDLDSLVAGDPLYELIDLDELRGAAPTFALASPRADLIVGRDR